MSSTPPEAATAETGTIPRGWSDGRRRTLRAIVGRVIAGAPLGESATESVCAEVLRRMAGLAPHKQRDLGRALDLLATRVVGLATVGQAVAFADAPAAVQDAWLRAWAQSAVAPLRTAFQAFRRLSLGAHYGQTAVASAIGHAGPLHSRAPEVAWEGPLPAPNVRQAVRFGGGARPYRSPPAPPAHGPAARCDHRGRDQRDVHRTADVVVIGTGAGGAVAAARLAAAGLEVVVLEDGGYYAAADFTEIGGAARRAALRGRRPARDRRSRRADAAGPLGGRVHDDQLDDHAAHPRVRARGVAAGYGLTDYGARGHGAVFARVEREVHARPVPDDAHSPNNRVILDGARALGWRARQRDHQRARLRAQRLLRDRLPVRRQAGHAAHVHARGAGARRHAVRRCARRPHRGARARSRARGPAPLQARARRRLRPRHRVRRAHALTIDTPLVVVAGGAVGTPVLLERSGLGGGGVGQFLRAAPDHAPRSRSLRSRDRGQHRHSALHHV